ncbi:MAG TPA: dihydropteroate synthase [Terriglobales bacterium]|jgi:dihydropteroate synthase|nr:dihydropteroate synthase [Terriglobales bacterium]
MRPIFQWNLGGARTLELGKRTRIMGVVNVTPDSFSDGGQFLDRDQAVEHALKLVADGAEIIDIGGESTRPGAKVQSRTGANVATTLGTAAGQESVTEKEELDRVVPVIAALKQKRADVIVSVDTYKANVARAAVKAGAEIVNDVSGFRWDPEMKRTIAELKCGAVLMHMRGRPDEWKELPPIGDPVLLVKRELRQWAQDAILAGVKRDSLVLDPGFGFGKRFAENYPLVARFAQLQEMGFPILVGTSRKSFIGRTLAANGQDAPTDRRLYGTLATETVLIVSGAHIVRTHDVKATTEVVKIADAIVASG